MIAQPQLPVPKTIAQVLDADWLSQALASVGQGGRVIGASAVEVIGPRTTKLRFTATFDGPAGTQAFCIKGNLDVPPGVFVLGTTCVHEGDFYLKVAPNLDVRTPEAVAVITDREAQESVLIMRDVIADGGRFCSALEEFGLDQVAQSLEQIARVHAGCGSLDAMPWISPRIARLAMTRSITPDVVQQQLEDPRGDGLDPAIRRADRLIAAMLALAEADASRAQLLVHGDVHAGNIFRTSEGIGIIDWQVYQRAGWAIDVAYHICAVLPAQVAEREERRLLRHYLDVTRGLGLDLPDEEEAWSQYREAAIYGFYMWAITRLVDPQIIREFTGRLGKAVMRHESHALLGVT